MSRRTLLPCLALLLAASAAEAQLQLPRQPVEHRPAGQVELPEPPRGLAAELRGGRPQGPDLVLPRADSPPPPAPRAPAAEAPAPTASAPSPARSSKADFILGELARLDPDDLKHGLLARAETSLVGLGEEGLGASRAALYSEHPPSLLVSARVLLRSGHADEVELVLRRLAQRLPRQVGTALFEAVVELDPVRASPAYLAELLGHSQSAVRAAAQRALEQQASPSMLGALLAALEHDQTDTRLRAVQIVSRVRDPAVLPLLLQRLDDRSSTVAVRAVGSLAVLADERVENELLRRAFGMRWILRDGAYALLAIIEREDKQLALVLGGDHVDALLEGLGSSDVFVAGACASALAGIGFRSDGDEAPWLDRAVPHQLVRVVGGEQFHNDYSALQPIALRRLALITGEHFGSDGPRWMSWWAEHAEGFRARRAVLKATPAEAGRMSVVVRSTVGLPSGLRLLGAEAGAPESPETAVMSGDSISPAGLELETIFLTASQARELYAVLAEEGAFGIQRLPGLRGDAVGGTRGLEIAFGGPAKSFSFGPGRGEPWFERVLATAEALRDVNRWQRFLPEAEGDLAARRARWALEADWWEGEPDERVRELRLKQLVLESLAARRPSERDAGAAELARLLERGGSIEAADFAPLLELLRGEFFVGPRARSFLRAALEAARLAGADGAVPAPELVRELVDVLLAGFGSDAARELSQVLAAAGRDVARQAAADPRPFVRAVAAATLAEGASEQDFAVLRELLVDADQGVEIAAVLALGEQRVEAARTELLIRARVGDAPVRAAALQAVGRLGGEGAFDALLVGLAERRHPQVAIAAAGGLAELGDPAAAPLFVSILAQGPEHEAFEAARDGLLRLGAGGREALLRVVHTPAHRARRDAALILARQGAPEVASTLMSMLTEDPEDARVAEELAVLTAVDFRTAADPAVAWWEWWELVVHDDATAWLLAALERAGTPAPDPRAFEGEGTREGALLLYGLLGQAEPHLAERARRELGRLLAGPGAGSAALGAVPADPSERQDWLQRLRERIEARYK